MEYILRRSMVKDRSPEDIIVGTLLAHCIRAGINNEALSQDGNLWKDEWHTEKGLFRHGMNFEYLLQRYGIAWLPARKFNWEKLHLIPEVEDNCSCQNNAMNASYRKRHMAVKAVSILSIVGTIRRVNIWVHGPQQGWCGHLGMVLVCQGRVNIWGQHLDACACCTD